MMLLILLSLIPLIDGTLQPLVKLNVLSRKALDKCSLKGSPEYDRFMEQLYKECDLTLVKDEFEKRNLLLCVSAYDSLQKLCDMNETSFQYLKEPPEFNPNFCKNASSLYKNFIPSLQNSITVLYLQQLLNFLQIAVSDEAKCTALCQNVDLHYEPICLLSYKVNQKWQAFKQSQLQYSVVEDVNENKSVIKLTETPKRQEELPKLEDKEKIDNSNPDPDKLSKQQLPKDTQTKSQETDASPVSYSPEQTNIPMSIKDEEKENLIDDNQQMSNADDGDFGISKEHPENSDNQGQPKPPKEQRSEYIPEEDSNFFSYFVSFGLISLLACVLYHYRNKVIALLVEGKRTRSGRGSRDARHNSTSYSKLNCNLEETVSNSCAPPSAKHVIY